VLEYFQTCFKIHPFPSQITRYYSRSYESFNDYDSMKLMLQLLETIKFPSIFGIVVVSVYLYAILNFCHISLTYLNLKHYLSWLLYLLFKCNVALAIRGCCISVFLHEKPAPKGKLTDNCKMRTGLSTKKRRYHYINLPRNLKDRKQGHRQLISMICHRTFHLDITYTDYHSNSVKCGVFYPLDSRWMLHILG
jgi:hypothetical protein